MKIAAAFALVFYCVSLGINLWNGDIRMAMAVFNTIIWAGIAVLSMD